MLFRLAATGALAAPAAPLARRFFFPPPAAASPAARAGKKLKASERWADAEALLAELKLEQYVPQFEEEEMTSMALLEEIVGRADGEKELMDPGWFMREMAQYDGPGPRLPG